MAHNASNGDMFHIRRGHGEPVLLVHGLGSTSASWESILDPLAEHREVIAVDLPGHGRTPPLDGETSVAALADALEAFIDRHDLGRIDLVGSCGADPRRTGSLARGVRALPALGPPRGPVRLILDTTTKARGDAGSR